MRIAAILRWFTGRRPDAGRVASLWTVVDGLRVHARVPTRPTTPADAPAVVLVHGLAMSGRYMVPTLLGLAPRYRVYAPGRGGCSDVLRAPVPGRRPGDPGRLRDDRRGVRRDKDTRHLHQAARDEQGRVPRRDLSLRLLGRHGRPRINLPDGLDSGVPARHHPHLGLRDRALRFSARGENGGARPSRSRATSSSRS